MAQGKKSFLMYADQIDLVEMLPDELAGRLFKVIMQYVNDKNPEVDDLTLKLAFEPIKKQLKRDLKRYEDIVERNRKNGAKGGRPPEPKETQDNPVGFLETQHNPEKPDNDTDTDNDTDIKEPPTPKGESVYTFDEFWNDYDKRKEKKKCERKWERISEKDKEVIKERLPLYVESTPDKTYRKNPYTWLNGQCWEDEIEQPKPKGLTIEQVMEMSGLNPDGTPKI